jgi:GMP reductase
MRDFLLSYDNIYLRPKFSTLPHRSQADTSQEFLGRRFKLPVIPANMEDVIGFENAKYLATNDYFYIMHRFRGATFDFVDWAVAQNLQYISISVGVGDESKKELDEIVTSFGDVVDFLTIDVAHGHHQNVEDMMKFIHDIYDGRRKPKIIAGNVATSEGYRFLCGLGVDAVKVGIGGGSICTTRYETGFHLPTAASILDIVTNTGNFQKPIIADGGIKHHGDIAKALVLGADMGMCGGLFASCIDSPAQIVHGKKIYRGSTSYAAKGNDAHVEGKTIELEGDITYAKRLSKIQDALRSSISYAGGENLTAFSGVEWDIVC